ncbi:MAG: hypothetical protein OEZ51_15345, partial [Nitrospinota bacterium]|nr:hypothetical protein [Nitrospinota bacterium]
MIKNILFKKTKDLKASESSKEISHLFSPWATELIEQMTFNCANEREKIENLLADSSEKESAVLGLLADYQIRKIR